MRISILGDDWDDTMTNEQKEELFSKREINESLFYNKLEELLETNNLLYKINNKFYKKKEGLLEVLSQNLFGKQYQKGRGAEIKRRNSFKVHVEKTMIETIKPCSETLKQFGLHKGQNDLVYKFNYSDTVTSELHVKIHFYPVNTKFVVSDIDGTITKSDVLGYLIPFLGFNWHFDGLVDLYNRIRENGYEFVYLTARSIHEYGMTRKYVENVKDKDNHLPKGPILMYPKSFMGILKNDLITKRSDVYKSRMLKEIQKLFPRKTDILFSGLGNQKSDAIAYTSVGINKDRIFFIKKSTLYQLSGKFSFTFNSLCKNVDKIFPKVLEEMETKKQETMEDEETEAHL